MASSSSSLQSPRWSYDVFLSFRGEDTRKTFTSHLYEGLKSRGIFTFQDDKRLEHGASISEELLKCIQESQVAVIIFSKNYASSCWCLDELVKIMECKIQYGQIVIPIFYDVDPSTVRYQKESFADAFKKHESNCKVDDVEGMHKVHRWRTTLTAAANLRGYDIRQGIESENIQLIVGHISSKLCTSASISSLRDIVGMNAHIEKLKNLLELEISDVRMLGIWGMGGVGKTTIAKAIFDTVSYQFEAVCFLADVKENEKRHHLHSLQNTLLSELFRCKGDYVTNKYAGKSMISSRLGLKKVLIVLDDIDHGDHLEYLAGDLSWYGNGSRIIATTRDKHLIGKNIIYEVTTLADLEAVQLFNKYAFKKEIPDVCFKKLTLVVVNHAKGLPLALKVWGSLLHNRDITEWASTVERIKKNSSSEIVEKLKISFDGLEPEEQEIFLDIACYFRGHYVDDVRVILEGCYCGAKCSVGVLIEKSLVFTTPYKIEMHDLLQDMGKYAANLQKGLGKRSRLCFSKDFERVNVDDTGTKDTDAIEIRDPPNLDFCQKVLKNMNKLRILRVIQYQNCSLDRLTSHDGSIKYLPNSLCQFLWHFYPWESLPSNFEPKRLVHLELRDSLLRHLWTGTKHLPSLRTLNLEGSRNLMLTPDFTGMPNLNYLYLNSCVSLEEIHHSVGRCRKLMELNLNDCELLERFPLVNVESLKLLNLAHCSSLERFPEIIGQMRADIKMYMWLCRIRDLSSSFVDQTHLIKLDLRCLEDLVALPSNISRFKSLFKLDVSYCLKLENLPEEIGDLESLEELLLRGNNFERLPPSIAQLGSLRLLDLAECERLNELPELPPNIQMLRADFRLALKSIHSLATKYKKLQSVLFIPLYNEKINRDNSDDNEMFAESLFHCIFSALDCLCDRVIYIEHPLVEIPSWFPHQRMNGNSLFLNLPANWYVPSHFLGFALCCYGDFDEFSIELLPLTGLCLWDTHLKPQKLTKTLASRYREYKDGTHFWFIPLASLWNASKANGATPNEYGHIKLCAACHTSGEIEELGFHLLYKDETAEVCIGVASEACCSSSSGRLQQQVEELGALETLHLRPERLTDYL